MSENTKYKTTAVRTKITIPFWLKKLAILLKVGVALQIVVKMFTRNGLKSWLVKLLRIMLKKSQDISEEILGTVPRKFLGIGSKELFSWNSQEFPQIW